MDDFPKADEAELARLRPIRDQLGEHGDLFMRLSGFYWVGPRGTREPEFGYRDTRKSRLYQTIQAEAAQALAELADVKAGADQILWCVRIINNDGLIAVRNYEDATLLADRLNIEFERARQASHPVIYAYPMPWPGSAQDHAGQVKQHWGMGKVA